MKINDLLNGSCTPFSLPFFQEKKDSRVDFVCVCVCLYTRAVFCTRQVNIARTINPLSHGSDVSREAAIFHSLRFPRSSLCIYSSSSLSLFLG